MSAGNGPYAVERSVVFANGDRGALGYALIVDTATCGHTNACFASSARIGIGCGALWGDAGGAGRPLGTEPIAQVEPNVCDGGACPRRRHFAGSRSSPHHVREPGHGIAQLGGNACGTAACP